MTKLTRFTKLKPLKSYQYLFRISYRPLTTPIPTSEQTQPTLNTHYNPMTSYITFDPLGNYEMYRFDEFRNTISINKELHSQYMSLTPMDILESLALWSLLSNKKNIANLYRDPIQIKEFLTNIGFSKLCPPNLFTKYYSQNFVHRLDEKLMSPSYSHHSELNFIVTRNLQVFEFLHWRFLNSECCQHIHGRLSNRKNARKYKSQLRIESDKLLSNEVVKILRYLRIDSLYLALYDMALNDIESIPLSYTILQSWISHGFHMFIAANPGHLKINHSFNPLHEMYCNAFYHILSDKPRFVDVKTEYGKKIMSANDGSNNKEFVFNTLFFHILRHFGVGNVTALLKKVLLRCIISDRNQYRNRTESSEKDLLRELTVFENRKFCKALSDIFSVYGKRWQSAIKDRLYSIILRYLCSVGEIDAARYVFNQCKKSNYFGTLDTAYNLIKICEALNTYIDNGLLHSYQFHSDPLSGTNDTKEYFIIRTQQCTDLLSKLMRQRNKQLLQMCNDGTEFGNVRLSNMSDNDRVKLEKLSANFGGDITTVTHRILYCLNQLQIAIKQFEIGTNEKLPKFNYSSQLLQSLVCIERVHREYPLSNDWAYLKPSEQKQMFLDIANGIRSGVLISKMSDTSLTKILKLRLLNHYGSLWHIIPFKEVLSSALSISEISFNTFLQSLNINLLPHSEYRLATFFRISSLYLSDLSATNELQKSHILTLVSKLVNILQYSVGESTSNDYFLLNIKLLLLAIKNGKNGNNELKCIFCKNIYDKMVICETLITDSKHFIPDLELCEMILFEWFVYFAQNYKNAHSNNNHTFKDLYICNNLMSDLLDYAISMKIFDSVTSHPLIFHLTLFTKLLNLLSQSNHTQTMHEIQSLWDENQGLSKEFTEPIKDCMTAILNSNTDNAFEIHMLEGIITHLMTIWSPLFSEISNQKKNERIEKQRQRWQEMIEPQLMSVLSPKQMRFVNNYDSSNHPLTVSHWFNDYNSQKQILVNKSEIIIIPTQSTKSEMILAKNSQTHFEEFVNELDIEYLKHLVSYDKFMKTRVLEKELSVNEYISNLNESGVYVDPEMSSFISSIEPLIRTMKQNKKDKSENLESEPSENLGETIDHSQIQIFLGEIESIYSDIIGKREQKEFVKKKNELLKQNKIEFVRQLNVLFRDRPKLQRFLDGIQSVIDQNKYNLSKNKKKTYSLAMFKPKYIGNEGEITHQTFESWNEFERNVMHKNDSIKQDVSAEVKKYLGMGKSETELQLLKERNAIMIGDLDQHKVQRFLKTLQTLPIKANMSQETYAMTKLVKEMDELY